MMKFILFLALLAFYSATPTLGLKCYTCTPYDAPVVQGFVRCDEFEKLNDAEKKSKATDDCGTDGELLCATTTSVVDKNKIFMSCFSNSVGDRKIKIGCDNDYKSDDQLDYKICGCNTDYCNSETKSGGNDNGKRKSRSPGFESPKIFILGVVSVLTFLISLY